MIKISKSTFKGEKGTVLARSTVKTSLNNGDPRHGKRTL